MSLRLKPYPEYKDSRLPWLGDVPAHWDFKRAKWLFDRMQRPVRSNDEVVTCFRDGTVTLRKNRRTSGFTESLKEIGYQGVRRSDLVIHAMDAFAGAIGVSDSDGKSTPVYAVCQPKPGINPHFYAHIVREMARTQYLLSLARGIRERSSDFRFEIFAAQFLPLPPTDEQNAIAEFLEVSAKRINRLIHTKQRLIKLLNEQKQAIIHSAVTRGLNPNVRLKPSGVDLVGAVPEHWEVLQVRRLVSFITSGSRGWANYYSDTGDIFLQSGNLGRSMSLNLSFIQYVQPPKSAEGVRTRVQRDDVLICVTGALTGNVALVDLELHADAYVNQHVALIRPKSTVVYPKYLASVLHSDMGKVQFKVNEYGGTKQGLGLGDVKSLFVPLPPIEEQIAICSGLEADIAGFNEAINRVQREVELIREYRTRLIADVVTGKLDVRGVELPAISEEEELDAIDSGDAPEAEELDVTEESIYADD